MSVRLPSSTEIPRITTPSSTTKSSVGGWQNIPHINQLRPQGADKGYVNGAYNCGPAVVAMLARGWGRMGNVNDAQLINQLGKGIVSKDGTDADGMMRMLKRADVPLAGEAMGADFDTDDLNEHLDQGHKVIAQVRASDPSKVDKDSAHYVLIQGKTKDGNYNVSDPLSNKSYTVTPKQLKEAVLKAPPDGGMLIPISSPAEGKRAASVQAPTQDADMPVRGARKAVASRIQEDGYEGVAPRGLKGAGPQEKAPNEDAFKVTDDVLAGVDTRYQDSNSVEGNAEMDENEWRNQGETLNVRYSNKKDSGHDTSDVIGNDKDEDTAAQELRERKKGGDMDVFKLLAQLEKSISEKDKKVLDKIKEADKKDPGIGKRIEGDGF